MERVERVEVESLRRAVVPGRKVTVSPREAHSVLIGRPEPSNCQPRIELVRDGDVLQAIDVTCGCGERIRIRCLYETED